MADNSDEEHLENPTNIQSENPSDDITLTKDAETINPNQATENMEVHAHDLHKAPGHGWKHYIFEFLMLFLAVFCGFLAEYKLEHIIENQREEKYIHSLIKDTELDIASSQKSYDSRKIQIIYFDSLLTLLKHGYSSKMNDFYYYAGHITSTTEFQYHDRTIQQLKNSGNLRLIKDDEIADSLTIYDNEIIKSLMVQQEDEFQMRINISKELSGKVLNAFVLYEMTDSTGKLNRPLNNPSLATSDPLLMNQFSYKITLLKSTALNTNRQVLNAIHTAQNLNALLRKKYQIE